MRNMLVSLFCVVMVLLVSCEDATPDPVFDRPDASNATDSRAADANGRTDATTSEDASPTDSDLPDAARSDAKIEDAAAPDATTPDATTPDASVPDASKPDASLPPGYDGYCKDGESCRFSCARDDLYYCAKGATCTLAGDGRVECEMDCADGADCKTDCPDTCRCGVGTSSCRLICYEAMCGATRPR